MLSPALRIWIQCSARKGVRDQERQGRKLLGGHRVAEFSKPRAWISHRTILAPEEETGLQTGGAPGWGGWRGLNTS